MRRHFRGHSLLLCLSAFLLTGAPPAPAAPSRWIRLRSGTFELLSSASPRNARDTIRDFEQVRGFFLQAFGGQPAKETPVRLVLFGSPKEYEPYRLNEYAAAYYQQTADRDYIVMSRGGSDTFPIAVHEYVHLLVRHSGLKLPPWLSEGLAELYSTLRPVGDKILIGDLIAGRFQALLREKWVPLSTILAVDHSSPYYNEKDKAGSLYNEGWGLTHMLYFRAEYRVKFGEVMHAISNGKGSAQALSEAYGRSLSQIEKDLQSYLRGSSFQGALVAAKLDKSRAEIPVEEVAEFDVGLMRADLLDRPGNEAGQQRAMEELIRQDPQRPEPYRSLGYLAWRRGRQEEAVRQFGNAFARGERDAKLLWDYGRLLESKHPDEAVRVLSELLSQDAGRTDVRLELAETQLRANQAKEAVRTLAPIRRVTQSESARFFRTAVYAHLLNGDAKDAEETAKRFRDVAKTDEDRALAEALVRQSSFQKEESEPAPERLRERETPTLHRAETGGEPKELRFRSPEVPTVAGRFVELDCQGRQARMIVETTGGRKVFLIADPERVAITAGSTGPVDMVCGTQKPARKVEIGFAPASQAGLDGIVRTLAF